MQTKSPKHTTICVHLYGPALSPLCRLQRRLHFLPSPCAVLSVEDADVLPCSLFVSVKDTPVHVQSLGRALEVVQHARVVDGAAGLGRVNLVGQAIHKILAGHVDLAAVALAAEAVHATLAGAVRLHHHVVHPFMLRLVSPLLGHAVVVVTVQVVALRNSEVLELVDGEVVGGVGVVGTALSRVLRAVSTLVRAE
ncbi:hypothetical protein B484DRAFT_447698 [Ochromonadaceae sp. CCMP2298]|nr:hypothetical protein B484DRAFT_447698 [Ochromonadaceae sp. CCMP2298]